MAAQLTQDVHLLVLIHGMWGSTSNLASMHRIMKETRLDDSSIDPDGTAVHVMLPETNQDENTYDGIDWGGERVAVEVCTLSSRCQIACLSAVLQVFEEIEKLAKEGKRVTRFSVTGYSLGGLVARYLVGCVLWPLLLSLLGLILHCKQDTPSAQVLRHRNSGQLQHCSNSSHWPSHLSFPLCQTRLCLWAPASRQDWKTVLCHG